MPAEIQLIVGLEPVAETGNQFTLIVPLEPAAGDDIEDSVRAVSVVRFIAASLHLQIVNVLRVNHRAQVRGNVRVGDGDAVNQPFHLMSTAHMQHVVSHVGSGNVVGNHGHAVATVGAGSLNNILP